MNDAAMNELMTGGDIEHNDYLDQSLMSPGRQLAVRREELGWSVDQVASRLNLAPRQIEALEADNLGALPGMVIARGFIRTYAKLLKLDSAPMLAMVAKEADAQGGEPAPLRHTLSASFSESRLPSMIHSDGSSSRRRSIALAVIVAVIGMLVVIIQMGVFPDISDTLSERMRAISSLETGAKKLMMPSDSETTITDGITSPSILQETASAPASVTVPVRLPVSDANAALASGKSAVPATVTPVVPATVTPVVPATVAPVVPAVVTVPPGIPSTVTDAALAGKKDTLVLKMREDSWLEIKDTSNKVLLGRVIKAGETEVFSVTEPIVMTVGNVAGVDATLRGKAIDMKSSTKTNVVKMSLK